MRRTLRGLAALLLAVAACEEVSTGGRMGTSLDPAFATGSTFPALIELPGDFGPEGIAVGHGSTFYVGSVAPTTLGQILVGDLGTAQTSQLVAPTGRMALGIKHDARSNLLYVAGGPSGRGTLYDARTGAEVRFYQFAAPPSIVNDVVVAPDAAYFTDSQLPSLYRVALDSNGRPGAATALPLPPNFAVPGSCVVESDRAFPPDPGDDSPPHNSNGIVAADRGRYLILMHMSEGTLYRVDPVSQGVRPIVLTKGGSGDKADLCSTDGLLLDGTTLYAVQNFLNRIAVITLAPDYLSGRVDRYITEPFASDRRLKVPTTIAEFNNSLYAVTAGFTGPSPDYVVRIAR